MPSIKPNALDHSTGDIHKSNVTDVTWNEVLVPPLELKQHHGVPHTEITPDDTRILVLVVSLSVLVIGGMISASGRGSWRYYLAGGLCAATSHTIPVPIDVVKTRKQVDPDYQDMHVWQVTKCLVEREGPKSLLAGLGPTTFGYLLEGAIKFGVYEVLKPIVTRLLSAVATAVTALAFLNTQLIAFVTCATISGMSAAVVLAPMEALRIRLVAEPDFSPNGWIIGARRMLKEEGVGFLVKGLKPMMYKQVPYTVVKNVSFDFFAKHAYSTLRHVGIAPTATVKFTVPLLSAAMASILSCIGSQPGDMLLSLVNAHGGNRRTRDIVKDILRSERGVYGFFVGIKTRLVHVGLIVTLQLLLYDFVKRLCGIAATGLS